MTLNNVQIVGNIVRDPELRYTPKGTAVTTVSLGVNERFTVDGEERTATAFVDATVWGKPAVNLANLAKKGTEIYIEGSLKQEIWQDKTTGQSRSKISINSSRWDFTQHKPKTVEQTPEPAYEESR